MPTYRDDRGRFSGTPGSVKDHRGRKLPSVPAAYPDFTDEVEQRRDGRGSPLYPGARNEGLANTGVPHPGGSIGTTSSSPPAEGGKR